MTESTPEYTYPVAAMIECPRTVAELLAFLAGVPGSLPLYDALSEAPVVAITADYVAIN